MQICQLPADGVEDCGNCSSFRLDLARDVRQGNTEKCHLVGDVLKVDFLRPLSINQPIF